MLQIPSGTSNSFFNPVNTTPLKNRHPHTPNAFITHSSIPLTQTQPNPSLTLYPVSTPHNNYTSSQLSPISDATHISTTIPHFDTHDPPTSDKSLFLLNIDNDQIKNDTLCLTCLLLHQGNRREGDSRPLNTPPTTTTPPQTRLLSTKHLATYDEMICKPILPPSQRDRIGHMTITPQTTQHHYPHPTLQYHTKLSPHLNPL